MRNLLSILFALFLNSAIFGQLSGSYTIPSAEIPSVRHAMEQLNLLGAGNGGVTFNITAGYVEVTPDSLYLEASGKSGEVITFQKSGSGANPLIRRTGAGNRVTAALGGNGDAVVILQGCDHVMFDGLDITTEDQGIEYGYLFRKSGQNNGCKFVTIKNGTIAMTKGTSTYVAGVYASNHDANTALNNTTGVTPNSISGIHENITITGNVIENVMYGILAIGYAVPATPYTLYDQNLVVGESGYGNIIRNFGGGNATTTYGIYLAYQNNANVSYNTVNNTGGGGTASLGELFGICHSTALTSTFTASHNSVSLTSAGTTSTTGRLYGIYSIVTGPLIMTHNSVEFNTVNSSSASMYYLYNGYNLGVTMSATISFNIIVGTQMKHTGITFMIYNSTTQWSPAVSNIQGNSVSGNWSKTGSGGAVYFYYNSNSGNSVENFFENNISNIANAGSGATYAYYSRPAGAATQNVYNNTISKLTGGTGIVVGIHGQIANTRSISGNIIDEISGMGAVYGINMGTGTIQSTVHQNKIYNLTTWGTSAMAYGIYCNEGTVFNIANNFISDLKAPLSNNLNAVNGIYINGVTTANLFQNTVYLNATSSGATFGSSAVYCSSASTSLDLRNNILANKSVRNGNTGFTTALRRTAAALPTNYATGSDNNDLYVDTTLLLNYLYYDGTATGKDSSIVSYKARMALLSPPRDGASFWESPPFVNTTSAPYDLHLQSVQSKCESGGVLVTDPIFITDDIDGQPRYPDPAAPFLSGYMPTAPDVGADEFAGIPNFSCSTPNPGNTLTTTDSVCDGQYVTLSLQNTLAGTGNTLQWQMSADNLIYSDIAGAIGTSYTFSPTVKAYYRCRVTCQNGPVSTNSIPVLIAYRYEITSAQGGGRCGTGTVKLEAEGTGPQLSWYDSPSGGLALGSGSPFYTPAISATTTYYVAAESTASSSTAFGAGAMTSNASQGPFYHSWGGSKSQYLLTGAELINAGFVAGNITALAFDVAVSKGYGFASFTLSMGHTSLSELTTSLQTDLTTVFYIDTIRPELGIFNINFTTPFLWDGVSNVIVETCWSNNNSGSLTNSAHVKYDLTSFISTAYYSGDNQTPAILCARTMIYGSYSSRPKMILTGTKGCTSPRTAVEATISTPPNLFINENSTICNDVVVPLSVLSNPGNYDQYTWSPATHLFTDAACTIPYTGTSEANVFFKSGLAGSYPIVCNALNSVSLCANVDTAVIVVLPANPEILSVPSSLCINGKATLSALIPASGMASFQWRESWDGLTFTDVAGATDLVYHTGNLGQSMWYKFVVWNQSGEICTEPVYHLVANNPLISSTMPGFHCGPGVVNLSATGTTGQLAWYGTPNGGAPLGYGSTFTTPYLWQSTNFYVSALEPGTILESAGRPAPVQGIGAQASNYGEVFTVNEYVTLQSVDVYPITTAGQLSVSLYDSTYTLLEGPLFFDFPAPGYGTLTPYTLALNFRIPPGSGYILLMNTLTGGNLLRETSNITYPINNGSLVSLTAGATSLYGISNSVYNWFYNWRVVSGCASPVTPVLATINLAPFYELTPPQTVCYGDHAMLTVQNGTTYFDSLTWLPVDHLYLDAAGTIPYDSGTIATTVYFRNTTPDTYLIRGFANNNSNGCTNFDTTYVTVLPQTIDITANPEYICYTGPTTLSITPVMDYGSAIIQWQSSTDSLLFSDIPGATNTSYSTGTITAKSYFRVIVKNTNYDTCLIAQTSIHVYSPAVLSFTNGSRCGAGTVQLDANPSPGTTLRWYPSLLSSQIIGTGSPFITPFISSTTSYYAAAVDVAPMDVVIGDGTNANTRTSYPAFYGARNESVKTQILFTAEDLYGAGVSPGTLDHLGIDVIDLAASGLHKEFTIKMAATTLTSLTTTFVTAGVVTVYGPVTYQPVWGHNQHTFTTPYVWDGVSNLIIEICHSNDPSGTGGTQFTYNAITNRTQTSYTSVAYRNSNNTNNCPAATASTTSNLRPNIYLAGLGVICGSDRQEVIAEVFPANPINLTPDRTICPNEVHTLVVTSNPGEYNSYTWTPIDHLFLDQACNVVYSTGDNATTVYFKSSTGITTTYTCESMNTTNGCNSEAQTTVTVIPDAAIKSVPEIICYSGSATLSLLPDTGYGASTYQWKNSLDNISFSDIPGATGATYTTPVHTSTSYYKVIVKNSIGDTCIQPNYSLTVNNPEILSTTPALRCGPGTLQLSATATPGSTVYWYDDPTAGARVGTGLTFTTPMLNLSTNYYASAGSGGSYGFVGKSAINPGATTSSGTSYISFTAHSAFKLMTVDIFPYGNPGGPGTVNVELRKSSGELIATKTLNAIGYNSTSYPAQRVALNFDIQEPDSYRLWFIGCTDGISGLYRDPSGFAYPYTFPGIVSITGSSASGYYHYFYNWQVSTGCESARQEVTASVTPAPELFISGSRTICANEIFKLEVTSPLEQYDNYTWSPATSLYMDSACTIPYTELTNDSEVYLKSPAGMVITYTCSASSSTGLMCSNMKSSIITVIPQTNITASPQEICFSGNATLSLNPATGYGLASIQWQESADSITFNDINGATGTSYITPTVSATHYYKVKVFNESGLLCNEPAYTLAVNNPQVLTTTPGTRCGVGTVDLHATANSGSELKWYASDTGDNLLGTGEVFTTPLISSTTSYYVAASQDGTGDVSVGPVDNLIGSGSSVASNYYMTFNVTYSSMTLNAVYVYPGAIGNVIFYVADDYGRILKTVTCPVTVPGVKTLIPIGLTLPAGTGYRIGYSNTLGSVSLYRNQNGASYPYTLPGIISITGSNYGNANYYFYFYDWQVSTGCESPRQQIIATVTPAPAISAIASPEQICSGNQTGLSVTSANPNYIYNWMPGNLSGANVSVSPTYTTEFNVTANDTVTGCSDMDTVEVYVSPLPSPLTVTPSAATIVMGSVQQLTANGGSLSGAGIFGTENTTNALTDYPAPYSNYYGGSKHQILVRAGELTAQGLYPGAAINTISFVVTAVGNTFTGYLLNFQIDMGHTALMALASASFLGGLTNVSPANTQPVAVGNITHTLATPFIWNGASNLVIQLSYSNGNSGATSDGVQMEYSNAGYIACNYYRVDGQSSASILAASTPSGASTNRPNFVLGFGMTTNLVWNPSADLYIDAAATIPYSGGDHTTVFAKPYSTTTYTVTSMVTTTGCLRSKDVTIEVLSPCEMPTNVTTSSITVSSATIAWTAPSQAPGSGYDYEVRTSGEPGSGLTGLAASGFTFAGIVAETVTGLIPNTQYNAYVRSNCGDNMFSSWTAACQFTTCSTISELPYYENFDGATIPNLPACWIKYSSLAGTPWISTNQALTPFPAPHSAPNYMYVSQNQELPKDEWLVSPAIQLSGGTAYNIKFWVNAPGNNPTYEKMKLVATINPTLAGVSTGTVIWTNTEMMFPGYIEYIVSFTPGTSNAYYFAWHAFSEANGDFISLDDVTVETGGPPVNEIVENVTVGSGESVCYNATNTITVSGNGSSFVVQSGGSATFIAGSKISLLPGTSVLSGGYLHGYIAPGGPWCSSTKIAQVPGTFDGSLKETSTTNFTLFPNPTNGNFTLLDRGECSYERVKVEVYSMSGERVLTENMVGQKYEFYFSNMPTALYFVKIIADDFIETIKLVKTN